MMKRIATIVLCLFVAAILVPFAIKGRPISTKHQSPIVWVVKMYVADDYVAEVIARSKFPMQLASIARQENAKHAPLLKSDGGDSCGLFMIQEKHWGPFDKTVEGQVRKAEDVLEKLIRRHGPELALQRWNGAGKDARSYAKAAHKKILAMSNHYATVNYKG